MPLLLLSLIGLPGKLPDHQSWRSGEEKCLVCNTTIKQFLGLVCVNFGHSRDSNFHCKGAWCGKCYKQHPKDFFPVLDLKDLDGSLVDDNFLTPDDEDRFRVAQNGNHLITPFQCDVCHFLNIHKRLPTTSEEDERLQIAIRRAILDSLWSTERSTVNANFYQMRKVAQHTSAYGVLDNFLPPRGPFPMEDSWGMTTAALFLARLTDSGRNAKFLQFDSVRKVRATISNFYHTCPKGTGSVFMNTNRSSP